MRGTKTLAFSVWDKRVWLGKMCEEQVGSDCRRKEQGKASMGCDGSSAIGGECTERARN